MKNIKKIKNKKIRFEVYYYEEGTTYIRRLLRKFGVFAELPKSRNNNKIKLKSLYLVFVLVFLLLSTFVTVKIFAEQTGSSPESGTDSKFTQLYGDLVTLGIGTEGSGYWGDWGSRWNRVMSSSTRIFSPYVNQSLQQRDDRDLTDWGDGGIWIQTNTTPGSEVWKDEITGLYWSSNRGGMTNEFVRSTCDFFTTLPRGNYDGLDTTCGGSINACASLTLDKEANGVDDTNWYLPSMLELYQAYIHGIYKKTNTTWVTTGYHWSTTEHQGNNTYAWPVALNHGIVPHQRPKSSGYTVRCILRDLN